VIGCNICLLYVHREWFVHVHPYGIAMTGAELMSQLGPDGEIDMEGWAVIWRLLRHLDAKLFKGALKRWRHVFEPQFAVSCMCCCRVCAGMKISLFCK
jgi:hypothetical protein